MTLYLKYRPQTLDELDLTSVRESLTSMIKGGSLPHAFLFSGPRGAGKTSAARIIAKILNCEKNGKALGEPCNECEHCKAIQSGNHMDVIEMDAASNRGIDDIRNLRESVMLSPSRGRKKVYIFDEVHMLTNEAANAFLKTLEEPPGHVVFILATTDPQKLPETVVSRLTNIEFSKATPEEIRRQLKRVSQGEGMDVSDEIAGEIAKLSDGSFRDAVKILEQLNSGEGGVTLEAVRLFGGVGGDLSSDILKGVNDRNARGVVKIIEKFASGGGNAEHLLGNLVSVLHGEMLVSLGVREGKPQFGLQVNGITMLLEKLVALRASHASGDILALEVLLVRFIKELNPVGVGGLKTKEKSNGGGLSGGAQLKDKVEMAPINGEPMDENVWMKILTETRAQEPKIEALLRAAKPVDFDGKSLNVGVYYRFHKERLESTKLRDSFEKIVEETLGGPVKISYCLAERSPSSREPADPPMNTKPDASVVSAAREIFGD